MSKQHSVETVDGTSRKKKRVQLDLGPKTMANLLWLVEELEASGYSEVLRKLVNETATRLKTEKVKT